MLRHPQEAQSLLLPISMPIIFSFIIMSIAAQDPGGSLSVWASIIPFSSPIVMMARIKMIDIETKSSMSVKPAARAGAFAGPGWLAQPGDVELVIARVAHDPLPRAFRSFSRSPARPGE